ncbi:MULTISPECIES: tetratricopeptide repeat protein [Methylotenera]|uniref:tetratricopeptide repeat protein n=1 Tax=Methylotenera TaxID=359407 RepID=UPI0003602A09|nr:MULTISPECIES: tetratricopeptide repeat protein [Methylotenera]
MANSGKSAFNSQPTQQEIQQLIGLLNNNQLVQAESIAKKLISKYPNIFILHHVLSLALDGQQKFAESVASYKNSLKLQPNTPDLLFNLGIALTHIQQFDDAIATYQKAIQLKPDFFEAYGNLGTVLQTQGQLIAAIESYQKGLKINPQDARGYFNLGTALRDNGALTEAVSSYKNAISLFPNYTDAHNNLGETHRDLGDMNAAVKCYQAALALNPNHAQANYNMAEFCYLAKRYLDAIPYFEASQLDDWQERRLYCLYKAEKFEDFKSQRDALIINSKHTSPFLATLSTHYSINFHELDPYNFCKNGLDFVYRKSIPELVNTDLLQALLNDINTADIAERKQGRLTNGQQSAGNLFKRNEASFQTLAGLIKQQFLAYKNHFIDADCELIESFPDELEFTSSWYVKMQQGGHLSAHIHELGWISGAVYLAMPSINGLEGAFEYGTHGDDYPIMDIVNHTQFPTAQIIPNVGDIVLFPSSLFHRTIPFNSRHNRICIAFDLKPAVQNNPNKKAK